MNKIAYVFAGVIGMAASFAGATAIPAGGQITVVACPVLGEPVTLNFSKNVSAAYSCDDTTSNMRVATCHSGGSRKPLPVVCASADDGAGGVTWNAPGCTTNGATVTISNYRGYRSNNQGGVLGVYDLGGACSAATADSVLTAQ
ncbi:hypothetical protein [Chitinolyticbacter albus]|uniref:hypothetical protein n=1 Tax=Chitinolyticbacter albus TaxID=2961951 RepID=UPI002109104E|nr:hypothetical protein [Chitinolyticbacter albus]